MAIDRNKIKLNVDKFVRAKKFPEAIRELQKLVEDNPKDINSLQQLGNLYLMAKDNEQAVPVFIRIAELYHKSGFTPKALASIKIALREAPENIQAQELYATFAEQTGLQRDAIDAYEKLVTNYTKAGQLDKAQKILEKLLELNPDNIKFQLQHGDLLTRLNKKEEAVPSYIKAAENLVVSGKVKEAAKIFERVLQIDPKKINSLEKSVGDLIARKESDKAIELLDSVTSGKEPPQIINELKTDILISSGQYDKAESILRSIAQKGPIVGGILKRFVKLYLSQGKYELLVKLLAGQIPGADISHLKELESGFEEVIAQSPTLTEAYSGLIVIERKLDNKGKLLSTLNKFSDVLIEKKEFKNAENVVKEMLEIAPNEMQLVDKLDSIREKLGVTKLAEPPRMKEPEIEIVEKEQEFRTPEEEIKVEEAPDVEIEVELEDISQELPVAEEETKKEDNLKQEEEIIVDLSPQKEKEEEIIVNPEEVEVTSSFAIPPKIDIIQEEKPKEVELEQPEEDEIPTEVKNLEDEAEKEEFEEEALAAEKGKEIDEKTAASIQEKLSEAQIFLKYGLVEKAITELKSIIKEVPDHIQAHQKLIGIYRSLDNKDKLVRQIIKLARVFKAQGDVDTAENLVEEAMQVDPNHQAIVEFQTGVEEKAKKPKKVDELEALSGLLKGKKTALSKARDIKEEAPPEIIEEVREEENVEEEIREESFTEGREEEKSEGEVDIEINIEQKPSPSSEEELVEVESEELEQKELIPSEVKETAESPIVEEESIGVEISEEEIEKSSEISEKLEEAEFYFAQELYEDAKTIGEELKDKYPDDVRIIDLLSRINSNLVHEKPTKEKEIEAKEAEETNEEEIEEELALIDKDLVKGLGGVVPAKRKPKVKVTLRDIVPEEEKQKEEVTPLKNEEVEEYYDLAKELGAVLDNLEESAGELFEEEEEPKSSEEISFEEVFQEFKKGVEKKVSEEDYDTHYNLGIAYKEMELVDEAIAEFQIAAKSPMYFADSCAMLGKCFQIKGMNDLAEKWYRKGLDSRGFPEDVYNGLKYDLAELLETMDRKDEALKLYKDVYASNANYREVKDRINSLS